jgi:hypothetical protein
VERKCPAHVLELLAAVLALRVFKYYLLARGAGRGERGAATRRVLEWLRSADGQPGDHVAEHEPASEQL